MDLSTFDFPFDPSLIATRPVEPRDQARLLVVDRQTGALQHRRVCDLPDLLSPGDLVVANDTKVRPARVPARKAGSGGQVEILFVRQIAETEWDVLMKGRLHVGQRLDVAPDTVAVITRRDADGTRVRIDSARPFRQVMDECGRMPLPPYIKREPEAADRAWYQTTFAAAEGAIAAPTAGLHITDALRARFAQRQIGWTTVTLHVGLGTFKPVTVTQIEDHRMEAEAATLSAETAEAIRRTRAGGHRIVAIGTTSVRTLESCVTDAGEIRPQSAETALFITPSYRFRAVDAMVTNFHFPKTTLLMLVSALAGVERMREAYRVAVQERYRFYSYGDAMLIL